MPLNLFEKIDYQNDPYHVVKEALNALGASGFIRAVELWKIGGGCANDGGGCDFPDDDDTFKGVSCYNHLDEEVVVSEEVFWEHLTYACQRYIELHPDRKEQLERALNQ